LPRQDKRIEVILKMDQADKKIKNELQFCDSFFVLQVFQNLRRMHCSGGPFMIRRKLKRIQWLRTTKTNLIISKPVPTRNRFPWSINNAVLPETMLQKCTGGLFSPGFRGAFRYKWIIPHILNGESHISCQ
jgi:hypothetical protein